MFKKLVSNLPFNPALIEQLSFYAQRLRREETTRRFGLGLVAFAFAVQIFISVSPPQQSLASDNNDLIFGGGTRASMAQAIGAGHDTMHSDLKAIYGYYGITADSLLKGQPTQISTIGSNNYYSVGRTHRDDNDIRVNIDGSQTSIFSRRLDVWARKSWDAVRVVNAHGQELWVLNDCGNVVSKGNYTPPSAPPPALGLRKQNTPTGPIKPGGTITYTLSYNNSGGPAPFTAIFDELPAYVSLVSTDTPFWRQITDSGRLRWVPANTQAVLAGTNGWAYPLKLTVKVNDNAPQGEQLCNKGYIGTALDFNGSFKYWGEPSVVCNTVQKLCPDNSLLPDNGSCPVTPPSMASCESLVLTGQPNRTRRQFEVTGSLSGNATVEGYLFDFGDGSQKQQVVSSSLRQSVTHDFTKPGTYSVLASVVSSTGSKTSEKCQLQVTIADEAGRPLPQLSKKARNITQNIADANGTTAKSGDVIEYTLLTTNIGDKAGTVSLRNEELSDVLEYSELDLNSIGDAHFDANNKSLSWGNSTTIQPNESVTKTFRVTVKSPIPSTPSSKSDPRSFDLVMFNEYGNDISIKLAGSPGKQVEQNIEKLPQTGPGAGSWVSLCFFMFSTYLYARSRTLRRESVLVANEFNAGGA